ncbi:hypothetical protein IT072_03840 [Leifsonia sp. ZF2019]|uniref:hypothetical protein n=1 Tax=Leifsonia sp. ZF2019 TaxID=2781978 RepID=UPI001CBF2CA7|nr:hypothetical protein [Leifsonia sp. ZF2019]UAJ80190.1 hypothetical protein IT072_03840 [Leifsonia sp. ZF2019]
MAMIDIRAPKPSPDIAAETIDASCSSCGWYGDVDAEVIDIEAGWSAVEITYRWTCPGPCGTTHVTRLTDGDDS